MPETLLSRLAVAMLMAWLAAFPAMAQQAVWVVLGEEGGIHAEMSNALRQELQGDTSVHVGRLKSLIEAKTISPDLLLPVGVAALDELAAFLTERKEAWPEVPVLAVMVPRSVAEARRASPAFRFRPLSSLVLDQPVERMLMLVKRSLPSHERIGLLTGAASRSALPELERHTARLKLKLHPSPLIDEAGDMSMALRGVLPESDVILALPDPDVYYKSSVSYILLTSYRARVPLVAYSSSFVRAGAIVGLYSTPRQFARRAAELIRTTRPGSLPSVQYVREFVVETNPRVAASFGLALDEPERIAEDLRNLEARR
jgi:hypothetical protein